MTRFSVDGESATSVGIEAEQRFLITRMRASGNGEQQRVVCAEPSPDVAKAYADAVSASLKVMGKGEVGISASSAQELATIGVRTATIQLLRDGLYRACEAYMNGALDDFGYGLILSQYDKLMLTMMSIEGAAQMRPAPAVVLGTQAGVAGASASQLLSATDFDLDGNNNLMVKNKDGSTAALLMPVRTESPTAGRTDYHYINGVIATRDGTSKSFHRTGDTLLGTSAGALTPMLAQPAQGVSGTDGGAAAIRAILSDYLNKPNDAALTACLMWLSNRGPSYDPANNAQHRSMDERCGDAAKDYRARVGVPPLTPAAAVGTSKTATR
jgi:hypothetical protein